jgi:two-component system, NarL family, nitrate/nitrite response regulator NarL
VNRSGAYDFGSLKVAPRPSGAGRPVIHGRLLVVEHRELVALGLQLALSERLWDVETTSGPTCLDVVDHARLFEPECVLLDIHLGDQIGSGIELIKPLAATGAQVVMLTAERRRMALAECVEAGAAGWISKNAGLDEVDSMLSRVVAGEALLCRADRAALQHDLRRERALTLRSHATFERLTQREALVLGALVDGLSAEEIADAHFVAVTTVRSQIRAVLQKLGVRSQLAAVALAGTHRELLPLEARAGRNRRRARPRGVNGPDIGGWTHRH